jgi:LuxR family maltose regulon positive regulatory protein
MEHWLAMPDADAAALAVERSIPEMLLHAEVPGVLGLLARLPENAVAARPALCVAYAQALLTRSQLGAAEQWLSQAERALQAQLSGDVAQSLDAEVQRALESGIATGRAVIASWRGDAAGAERLARAALAVWAADDAHGRAGPMLALGHALRLRGDLGAAEASYGEASRLSFASGNHFMGTLALTQRAYTLVLAGRPRAAAELYRQAIAAAESRDGESSGLAATAYAGLGDTLYQWSDLAGARATLERASTLGSQWESADDQISALTFLASTLQAEGHPAEAIATMARARELVGLGMHFPWLTAMVASAEARLALRQGRVRDAAQWAAGREFSAARYANDEVSQIRHSEYLTYARLLLAQDQPADAARMATIVLHVAEASGQNSTVIDAGAQRALARQAQGDFTGAMEDIERAVSLALPEGYVRIFADEGPPMRALLARVRDREPKTSETRRYLDVLITAAQRTPTSTPARHGSPIEPLSTRELEVLRRLACGSSNAEIARHLVIASSTVKSHLHHIFAKLHVSDRLSAVLRARVLGLLDD